MSTPFFSVVIPTYNAVSYLKRSLGSVFLQSFQNYEVIVVDNTSADGTSEYLNSIDDPRLSWFQVNNQGVIGYSRNVGIRRASGDWIAFLDADDEWKENKLEVMHRVLSCRVDIDVVVHAEKVLLEGSVIGQNNYSNIEEPAYESLLLGGNQLSPSSTVVRKAILEDLGGFSEENKYITAEDYELWLRLAKSNCKFHYEAEALGVFYRFKGTASSNIQLHQNSGNQVFYDHLMSWGEQNEIEEEVLHKLYSCRLLLSYGSSVKASLKNLDLKGFIASIGKFITVFAKGSWKGSLVTCLNRGNRSLYQKIHNEKVQ